MGNHLQRLRGADERSIVTVDDYASIVTELGAWLGAVNPYESTLSAKTQPIASSFVSLAAYAHGANGAVFSVMAVRQLVFSAIRFRWQRLRDGKPSDTFGTDALRLLETPWVGGTTQDLLSRVIQDADLAGNCFHILETPLARLGGDNQGELVRLRPDWMQIVTAPRWRDTSTYDARGRLIGDATQGALGYKKLGYVYTEGGNYSGNDPVPLLLDEVSHFMPQPDPLAQFRGMSWLTPIVREIENDTLMSVHKRKFFENGATPNMVIKHAPGASRDAIKLFDAALKANNAGVENAYKTLNLYPGADATVVGQNMEQVDFKGVQGAGETRIASAAGVPPIIAGFSEGLAAGTYSNYAQARRRLADGTAHPLWQNLAGSFAPLIKSPGSDSRLWYDASGVPFLREDEKDAADIQRTRAATIKSLIDAGYTPDTVIAAVNADDMRLLTHSGLYSVQLQPAGSVNPGTAQPTPAPGEDTPA